MWVAALLLMHSAPESRFMSGALISCLLCHRFHLSRECKAPSFSTVRQSPKAKAISQTGHLHGVGEKEVLRRGLPLHDLVANLLQLALPLLVVMLHQTFTTGRAEASA